MPLLHAASRGGRAAAAGWGLAASAAAALAWVASGLEIDVSAVGPERAARSASGDAGHGSAALEQPIVPGPIATYHATLNRPLFEATRRPRPVEEQPQAPPVAGAAAATPSPAEELRIVGIMRPRKGGTGSSGARVLVRSSDAQQAVWVETGASIGGWTVSAIGDRTVTVEGGGQRREINLFQPPASVAN